MDSFLYDNGLRHERVKQNIFYYSVILARHACGINIKVHILVDIGQFEDEIPPNSMQI